MTRQDLRQNGAFSNVVTPFNQTAARNHEVLRKREERRKANVIALKRLVVGSIIFMLVAIAGTYLYQSQKMCESINGINSRACVD